MKRTKKARRALITSLISLVLCCVLLLGTTFAWFTDSVTNTGNRIEAGKLDTTPLVTHTFPLREIEEAYRLFEERKDNVIKVAVLP